MKHLIHTRSILSLSIAAALLAATAPKAHAQLKIELEFSARNSHSPSWDASGSHLARVLADAAAHWETIYSGVPATTIRVHFRWYDPWRSSVGLTPAVPCSTLASCSRRAGALTPNSYDLVFWTNDRVEMIDWYVDLDVADHGEFELAPRMYLDPSDARTWTGLSGSPSGAFEVGFAGPARTSETKLGASGVRSDEGSDLFTVALHELGHALGLGNRGEADVRDDSDYDISPLLPAGGVGVLAGAHLATGRVDPGHLLNEHALMHNEIPSATRALPGLADVLAIAQVNGWTTLNPRRVLWDLPGAHEPWGTPEAWLPGLPNAAKGAVIHPLIGETEIDVLGSASAASVFLGQGTTLSIGAVTFQAGQLLALSADARLVAGGSTLSATYLRHEGDSLTVQGSGRLSIQRRAELLGSAGLHFVGSSSGVARLVAPGTTLRLLDSSVLHASLADLVVERIFIASAEARLEGGSAVIRELVLVDNQGEIRASNGSLRFEPKAGWAAFDLDGAAPDAGRLVASGGDLDFRAPPMDEFDGTMEIHAGRSILIAGSVRLGHGIVQLTGDEASLQIHSLDVAGGSIFAYGPAGSDARIVGDQYWSGGLADVAAGTLLHLGGMSYFQGGTPILGAGAVRQGGDAVVIGAATTYIQSEHYLWDGDDPMTGASGSARTTLQPGSALRITGDIAASALDGFDGVVVIHEGATLTLDRDWILEGRIELQGGTIRTGGRITNRGVIQGYGRIETQVLNDGAVISEGTGIDWMAGCYFPGSGTCTGGGCP